MAERLVAVNLSCYSCFLFYMGCMMSLAFLESYSERPFRSLRNRSSLALMVFTSSWVLATTTPNMSGLFLLALLFVSLTSKLIKTRETTIQLNITTPRLTS